ncbi:hypothetical protein B0H12DRAFT_964188, partial [Mycena haematopus]
HLTREWSTGTHVPAQFSEKENAESYHKHLTGINDWCDDNPEVTTKIRARWYKRASQTFGHESTETVLTNTTAERRSANRAQLEGRTGDTDSEEE